MGMGYRGFTNMREREIVLCTKTEREKKREEEKKRKKKEKEKERERGVGGGLADGALGWPTGQPSLPTRRAARRPLPRSEERGIG